MLKIVVRNQQPAHSQHPGQWCYLQPESGYLMHDWTIEGLIAQVKKHRNANQFPVGVNFRGEVENGIAMQLNDAQRQAFCQPIIDLNSPEEIQSRVLTSGDIKSFGQMVISWITSGAELVDQNEAERRGSLCRDCKYNIKAQGCMTCRGAVNAVKGIAGKSTSHDPNLHMCNICACSNASAVWLPKEVQLQYLSEETKASFPTDGSCWKSPKSL